MGDELLINILDRNVSELPFGNLNFPAPLSIRFISPDPS
jgi:hypothetical protein